MSARNGITYRCGQHNLDGLAEPCDLPHAIPSPAPAEIAAMRDGLAAAAERHPMPPRFAARPADDGSAAMTITDTGTGRETRVSLGDYAGVRRALAGLFGDDATAGL